MNYELEPEIGEIGVTDETPEKRAQLHAAFERRDSFYTEQLPGVNTMTPESAASAGVEWFRRQLAVEEVWETTIYSVGEYKDFGEDVLDRELAEDLARGDYRGLKARLERQAEIFRDVLTEDGEINPDVPVWEKVASAIAQEMPYIGDAVKIESSLW